MSAPSHSDSKTSVVALMQQLTQVMLSDRQRLIRRIKKSSTFNSEQLNKLQHSIEASAQRAALRRGRFAPTVNTGLPIADRAQDIIESIRNNPVTIIAGATGSGKTTQIPKLCIQAGYGVFGMIGHTQPRRIAARATATRIAEELACAIGEGVGYKIRFNDQTGSECIVKLMTDGMLLQEAQQDRALMDYDCLIVDEAHERSLNIDFLMGILKRLIKQRPQLRVVITSATINPGEFSAFFDDAPIIEVGGRSFPIEMQYHDPGDRHIDQFIGETIDALWRKHKPADVLVFLPGEREIRDTSKELEGRFRERVDVLPLYARLSAKQQNAVFRKSGKPRIILATNVAETSLTVPGIVYVIDTGTARISRYHYKSKLQKLAIEPISKASAAQRAGRCGRTQPGVCARLYSEEDFEQRSAYTDPEVIRTNLASVILSMQVLGLGSIEDFEFVQAPDQRFIKDGYRLLVQLQATNNQGKVTKQGRRMARYPLDPRLAKVLVSAVEDGCLAEMQIIAAGLSAGDPRERPWEHQKAADQKHAQFLDKQSDFLVLLNIWNAWREQSGTQKQRRAWCKKNFLSFRRLQEWNDVITQLRYVAKDLGHTVNKRAASSPTIHTALLRGFVDYIGQRKTTHEYSGARGRQFKIFPGSAVAAKPPAWVMASEIVETSQVFARQVAKINPVWVEKAASHLLRRTCVEEFWNKQQGRPMGIEEASLFGFVLNRSRRVPLARHDPVAARRAFIQHALVDNRWAFKAQFVQSNHQRRNELAAAESRLRLILLDEAKQFEEFDKHLPSDIVDRKSFVAWFNHDKAAVNTKLSLAQEAFGDYQQVRKTWYPDTMKVGGQVLNLSYQFDPSNDRDGVTLAVPAALVRYLQPNQTEWLIPGWLKTKTEALLRALPKSKRKQLVPVTDRANAFLAWAIDQQLPGGSESLRAALTRFVGVEFGVEVATEEWSHASLPDWLHLGLAVLDANGNELAFSRNLADLQSQAHGVLAQASAQPDSEWLRSDLSQWSFDDLPEIVQVDHGTMTINACPVLVDKAYRVDIELVPTLNDAEAVHGDGVLRLLQKVLADKVKYLRKNLPDLSRISLLYLQIGDFDKLFDDIVMASLNRIILQPGSIRRGADFAQAAQQCREKIIESAQQVSMQVVEILVQRQRVAGLLDEHKTKLPSQAMQDMRTQIDSLIYEGFVRATPDDWRRQITRYLRAIEVRINRLTSQGNERSLDQEFTQHLKQLRELSSEQRAKVTDYKWLLEEWRVSHFAQELGTRIPVSAKRVARYLADHGL